MKKLIGAVEVAEMLGVSLRKLNQMVRCSQLPPYTKIGRIRKWHREHIEIWIDSRFPKVEEYTKEAKV